MTYGGGTEQRARRRREGVVRTFALISEASSELVEMVKARPERVVPEPEDGTAGGDTLGVQISTVVVDNDDVLTVEGDPRTYLSYHVTATRPDAKTRHIVGAAAVEGASALARLRDKFKAGDLIGQTERADWPDSAISRALIGYVKVSEAAELEAD